MMDHINLQSSESSAGLHRAEEDLSKTPGTKVRCSRPRYAARACKECKRRKVKCNGKTPCHHCDRYDVQCLYPEKTNPNQPGRSSQMEIITQKLEMLQQQVSFLISREKTSPVTESHVLPYPSTRSPCSDSQGRNHVLSPAAPGLAGQSPITLESPQRNGSKNSASSFVTGPASLAGLDVIHDTPVCYPGASTSPKSPAQGGLSVACHPLLSLSQAEALRLIDIYEDECGSVYPLIDIEPLRCFATEFYDGIAASRDPANWRTFNLDQASKRPFNILEIVIAISLVIEGRGSTHLSSALMDELEAEIDHRPSGTSVDIPFAEILTLMSIYHFYRDEEVLAWRTIGLAARISLEMGLHLWDPPFAIFRNPQGREHANRLFWCIYCLDRRWSFGTGLPFGIQEDDIDPSLPEPNDSHPYLFTSMIAYSRIGSKILKASSGADRIEREDAAFLTYQVQQWYNSLDPEVRVDGDQDLVVAGLSPARNRLRILDHLRKNQLLMLIHRKALFTPTSIAADPRGAKTAVDLARSIITMLEKIRNTSEIYQSHAVCFNYFLYSALTVILLAAYHAKARFHEYCREEFNMALNLMGGISAKSNVARKLWKIIKHLKVMGPELGILPYMETQQDNPRRERDGYPVANDRAVSWSQNQAQIYDGVVGYPVQVLPGAREMDGLGNSIAHGDIPMFTHNYTVDGNLLCSELTDLFQAIDPTRFEQIPPQLSDQSRCLASSFPMAEDFSRTVRNVF